jgi:hypothetical protein
MKQTLTESNPQVFTGVIFFALIYSVLLLIIVSVNETAYMSFIQKKKNSWHNNSYEEKLITSCWNKISDKRWIKKRIKRQILEDNR